MRREPDYELGAGTQPMKYGFRLRFAIRGNPRQPHVWATLGTPNVTEAQARLILNVLREGCRVCGVRFHLLDPHTRQAATG